MNGEKKQSKVKILFLKSSLEYYNYENTSHKLNNCSDPTVISYLSNRHTKINRRLSNNKSNAKFVTITVKKNVTVTITEKRIIIMITRYFPSLRKEREVKTYRVGADHSGRL